MNHLPLKFSLVSIFCMLMVSCAPTVPRPTITFNWVPTTTAPPNSADIMIAFIRLGSEAPGPVFTDFSSHLRNDIEEILIKHGFTVRGAFSSYREMSDAEKAGSDLILVVDTELNPDISQIQWNNTVNRTKENGKVVLERYNVLGPVAFNGSVNLTVINSITTEILWTKKVTFSPITSALTGTFFGRYEYPRGFIRNIMQNKSAHLGVFADFLEKDNEFYATFCEAFSKQYPDIMKTINDYLHPYQLSSLIPAPEPDRVAIAFDYTPKQKAKPDSAGATFAVVGAEFDTPVPLYSNFARSMAGDFGEILTARGYGLRGPFETFKELLYPDKLASNLILKTQVKFDTDRTQIKWTPVDTFFNVAQDDFYRASGSITITGQVNLVVAESLTNETLWTRSIAITPAIVKLVSTENYISHADLKSQLEQDNQFHADVGNALSKQYPDIMKTIYDYLHPGEIALIMEAAADIRKRATITDK